MRAIRLLNPSILVKLVFVLMLLLMLSFTSSSLLAQDETPTEVPLSTETPVLPPTDVPTETVPTELPATPTEAVVTETPVTPEFTPPPTAESTPVLPPPVDPDYFFEDFQDADLSAWILTPGWSLLDENGNQVLTTAAPSSSAALSLVSWPYLSLSFRARVAPGANLNLNLSSGGKSYQITVGADGAASLTSEGQLLAQSAGISTDAGVPAEPIWHTVQVLAPGTMLAVKVDELTPLSYSDPSLTGIGPLVFTTAAENAGAVALDDIAITRLDAPLPPPVPAESTPVEQETVVPIPPPTNVTPEVTAEATPEAESTAEATLEAEATIEVTSEATPEVEATSEATPEPEATVEPLTLTEEGRAKLPPALVEMLDAFLVGDTAAVDAIATSYLVPTADGRVEVTIWAYTDADAADIAAQLQAAGDVVTEVFSVRVTAAVSVQNLLIVTNHVGIGKVDIVPLAVSSSALAAAAPTGEGSGTEITEGFDTVGAAAWSAAGIRGSGVNIAVIDTGFGASVINNAAGTEYACLFQGTLSQGAFTAGDTTHGLNVLQVLCDIAPAARAYMYKATTASELAAAITAANTANHKVILITMDLGASVSPGDGTGGGALYGIDAVYTAISTARAAGRVVIASAGNNNGRYVTLNYTSAATTIPMTVFGGDRIHVSWNDWSGTSQNVGLSLSGGVSGTMNVGGTPRVGPPSSSYTVQAGTCAVGCAINLNVTGSTSGIVLQVQVLGQGTIDSENITGATIASTAGNIARPADAQDVIAVGAVCNTNGSGGFPIDPYSSIGPVFGTGGTLQSLSAPYTRDQVKPDVVGPTHVSINNPTLVQNPDNPDEPTDLVPQGRVNPQNPTSCSNYTLGFNGTSAAAAHVAGMAALLVSNTNTSMSTFDGSDGSAVNAIQDYLQTHAIDLPMFTFGMAGFTSIPSSILSDSFDMTYGAGFTTLGNPSYNLANTTNPATEANQLTATCTTPIYVGQGNPGGPQSGTIANPYVSIAYALRQATTQCVVVLPGEYVSPIFIPSGVTAPGLQSYEGATSFASSPTYLWVTNNYNREGGFNVRNNDIVIDGFTVQSGRSYKFVDNYPSPGFVVDGGGTFLNNTFSNFFVPLRVQDSTAASFIGNTFSGFNIQATTVGSGGGASTTSDFDTAALRLQNAGTTGAPVVVRNNIFTTNTIQVSTLVTTNHRSAVLGIKNSAVNVYNNQFLTNTAGTLIGVNQWVGAVDSTKRTDEVRMVGNTFVGNTNNGPLIHLFQAPRMRFVNNTAVGNSMTGPQFFDEYFLYGHPGSSSGAVMYAQLSDRRMEIHNNLFYGNGVANDGLVATPGSDPIGCDAISGSNPLRNNWFLPVTLNDGVGADRASDCNTRVTNSITTTITPATTFFGSSTDAAHPYRLRPNDTVGDVGGINTGDNQALIDIFGDPGYLSLQLLDLRGTPRVRIGANANPTYNNVNAVDVGAYELDIPVPPEADDIDLVIIEDAAPSISIPLTATGGYIQTFAVTSSPANYDTNVNNACLGQPLRFTPPNTVTYCPPADFHTQYGAGNTHVPITFTYTVTDSIFYPAQPSTGTVTLQINPVDDGNPNVEDFEVVTDYTSVINRNLSPNYTLNNFSLGRNASDGATANLDWPFTFSYVGQTASSGQNATLFGASTATVIQNALTAANSNGGVLTLTPLADQRGYYEFTYRVTDRDGDQDTATATIIVLPTLAQEGNYDGASFYITYNGTGWAPLYFTPAGSNNTLHYTTNASESYEFAFTGGLLSLNMLGSGVPNTTASLRIEFNLDVISNIPNWVTYDQARTILGSGFSCTSTLNGQAPDASSNLSNYSASFANYSLVCRGFPIGGAQAVRVTNNTAGAYFMLNSIDVASGLLRPGLYQETNTNISYSGSGWAPITAATASGSSIRFTTGAGNSYSFQMTGGTRFALYSTPGPTGGTMQVCITPLPSGASESCVNRSNNAATTLWQQAQLFTGLNSATVYTVTVTNVSSPTTRYIDLDAVEIFPPTVALTPGLYQETNANITYSGSGWAPIPAATASGGSIRYTVGAGNSYNFQITGASRFALYTTPGLTGGTMQVCITPLPNGASQSCVNRSNFASTTLWQQQQVFSGLNTGTTYTVTVTNVSPSASQYIDLDAVEVLGPTVPLGLGLHQETNTNITFTGSGWARSVTALANGGGMQYTFGVGNSYTFQLTGAIRFALYTTPGSTGGTMQVCITPLPSGASQSCVNRSNFAAVTLWQQQQLFTGLDAGTTYTVVVTNASSSASQYIDLDAIEVLGPTVPLTPGLYQETNANISYTGSGWAPSSAATASGGSIRFTFGSGDSYSFQISGAARLALITSPGPSGGTMQVCFTPTLSGGVACPNAANNRSNFASAALWQQQQLFTGLDSGTTYTVTVTNVSSSASQYIDLDAVQVLGPTAPLTPGFYQENNANISYVGSGWAPVAATTASGGTFRYTVGSGNSYSFQISGAARFVLYTTPGPTGGTMQVCITPTPAGGVACPDASNNRSNNTAVTLWQQAQLFTGLDSGTTYTVTVTNISNPTTRYIDLDAVEVLGPTAPLTPGFYQETNANITYTGSGWAPVTATTASGGSIRFTSGINNSYSFQVSGATRFALYTTPGSTGGTMQVCISPTPAGGIACPDASNNRSNNAPTTLWQQQQLFTGLDDGTTYTVTVTNISSSASQYIDLDAIEVLGATVPLTPGLYQETNANIIYSGGGWAPIAATTASGGSFRYTVATGNSFTFEVSGAARFALYTTPGPTGGTMQVCITPTPAGGIACPDASNNRSNNTPTTLWQQQQLFTGLDSGTTYTIVVTNVSNPTTRYIDLDAIEVFAPPVPLGPGFYQETNSNITYTGSGWATVPAATASGGSFRYTVATGNSYTFSITGATRFALFTTPGLTGGTMEVCITPTPAGGTACPDPSNNRSNNAATTLWQQAQVFTGLDSGTVYTVVVTNVSNPTTRYIDLDAIQIIDSAGTLTPGFYQDTDLNLVYTGAWTKDGAAGASAGAATVTTTNNDEMRFTFTGTGFTIFTFNPINGAPMEVCYKINGEPDTAFLCPTSTTNPNPVPTNASPARANVGYAIYGLKSATYVVRVRHTGTTGSQALYLDSVAVLGAPSTTLTAGTYQNTDAAFVYSPSALWQTTTSPSYSGGSITSSSSRGATAQFRFTGNSLILYQYVGPTTSSSVLICRVLEGSVTNPPPQCASISQLSGVNGFNSPIAIYGFGSGTHEVVMENRNHGGFMNIDRITVN